VATVPAHIEGPSDAELIDAVRNGTVSAYGSLYERHVASAYNLARQLSRSPAEADDLVSEAFAKVLDTLRAGRGPDSAFRAYLLTALRHTAYDKTRRDRKIELSDDMETAGGARLAQPFSDTAVAGLERSLAARAFAKLPERWQAVLWHTEVEGQSPAEVAPILGLTPNGVSALAYRAREGLRQAYLQAHLADIKEARCRATVDRLGAWTRGGLSRREKAQVEAHLDECARCRALAAELADINGALRGIVAPLVLGAGTIGYLATTKAGVLTAAGATAGTAAGAATGAAAGGSGGGAAGAAGSLPRQFLGAAASAAVLAAVVAVGLTSGGGDQKVPAAEPKPTQAAPVPTQAPAQPNPPAPKPPKPPAQPQPPAPAPNPPAPQAPPPPPPPPPPAPTTEPSPPATPAPAALSASTMPVSVVAGGEPADLPITVRNSGGSMSDPVTATLNLPPGVSAVPAGDRYAAEPLLSLDGARAETVQCPGGAVTVTCTSERGLDPGESVTLLFRIVAAKGSHGGQITGTVQAGTMIDVAVSVRVDVRPPATIDGVTLSADAEWLGLLPGIWLHPTLETRAENTGTSTKPITLTIDQPAQLLWTDRKVTCASGGGTTCTTTGDVRPGETLRAVFELDPDPWPVRQLDPPKEVHVAATLGKASDSVVVRLNQGICPGLLTPTQDPPSTPSSPTTPSVPGQLGTDPTGEDPSTRPSGPGEQPADPPLTTTPTTTPPTTTTTTTTTTQPPTDDRPPERSAPVPDSDTPPSSTQSAGGLGGLLGWLLGGG
jgi:RNA polymerase sigma factor (sigma-70 family)